VSLGLSLDSQSGAVVYRLHLGVMSFIVASDIVSISMTSGL